MTPTLRGVCLLVAFGLGSRATQAAPLTADDVVRSALTRHPDAVASDAAVRAAISDRRGVGLFLDNPEISGGLAVVGGLVQGTINQPLSVTGEGWHARSAAAAGVDAAEADAHRSALRVAAQARATLAWAITTRERWSLADEAMKQTTRLREAAEAREAVGEGSQLHVRLARMAAAEATERAISARRDHASARAMLASYTPLAASAELGDDPLAVLPDAAPVGPRTDVTAAEARVRQAEATLARERSAAMPRVGVGLFAQRDEAHGDAGDFGPQVTLGLPIWTRNQGATGMARAELTTAQAELDALRTRVATEQLLLPEVAAYADQALGALGDFANDARAALESVEIGWTTGEIDVSQAVLLRREVLDGWAAALDARQATVEARLDRLLAEESPTLIPALLAEEAR